MKTLAELITLDRQGLFNEVVAYSRTMTEQATNLAGDVCLYRTEDGNACFVGGALIPDENYDPEFDTGMAHTDAVLTRLGYDAAFYPMIRKLQDIHDDRFEDREQHLADFAAKNNLEMPA